MCSTCLYVVNRQLLTDWGGEGRGGEGARVCVHGYINFLTFLSCHFSLCPPPLGLPSTPPLSSTAAHPRTGQ